MSNDNTVKAESLLSLQMQLRDLLFVRPFNLQAIETASIKLCDAVIDFDEKTSPTPPTDLEKAAEEYAKKRYEGWGDHVQRDYIGTARCFKAGANHLLQQGLSSEETYVIVQMVTAELYSERIFLTKEAAQAHLPKSDTLGVYHAIKLSDHISALHSWFGKGLNTTAHPPKSDPLVPGSGLLGL